jgi:hypothetical protein
MSSCGGFHVVPDPRVSGAAVVLLDIGVVIIGRKMGGDVRDPLCEPAAMSRRASFIGQAMPQADRRGDGGQAEAPRTQESAPIVPPALVAACPPILETRGEIVCRLLAVRSVGAARSPHRPSQPSGVDRRLYISAASDRNFARAAARSSKTA